MTAYTIRTAVPADMAAVRRVFRSSSLSNQGDRLNLLAHPDALELPEVSVREGRTRVVVAGGDVVGFATALATEAGMELEDLFVRPDWMGRGIGRRLVLDVVATARTRGVGRIEVTANGHALGFYRKLGFVSDGEVETTFGTGFRMHRDSGPRTIGPPAQAPSG